MLGRAADIALLIAIVVAPIAGGSSALTMIPLLALAASTSYALALLDARATGRSLHLQPLALGLAVLAAFTLFQAIPLPGAILRLLSPHAHEVREFVLGGGAGPITYETQATLREAAKLLVYLLIACAAYERARAQKSFEVAAIPIAAAGVASVAIAFAHRLLGLDQLYGVIPTWMPARTQMSTFSNPNHAAGFLILAALAAVGVGLSDRSRQRRAGFVVAGGICATAAVLTMSRGGLVALVFGFAVLGGSLFLIRRKQGRSLRFASPALLAAALILPGIAVVYGLDTLVRGLGSGAPIGLIEKLAAYQDALPMTRDHPLAGIGRGAYVSVYPQYKTSNLQLTFAFPENVVAQLVSEWGLVVGLAALFGLALAIVVRIWKARSVAAAGALAGVAAVLVQNLVDFSLELPGVAIPVIAVLAAAGAGRSRRRRVPLVNGAVAAAVIGVPCTLALVTAAAAYRGADLSHDLARMDAEIARRRTGEPTASAASFAPMAAAHPASAMVTARLSFLAETDKPPKRDEAIRWTNKTLYLAPTYASGHLAACRLIARSAHRDQAFLACRRAWELSSPTERDPFIDHVVGLARSASELATAIPRRDAELDVIDEIELGRAVQHALQKGKVEWARELIKGADPKDADGAYALAVAALSAGDKERAKAFTATLLERSPARNDAALLRARLLREERSYDELDALIDKTLQGPVPDRVPFLKMKLEVALERGDYDRARTALGLLSRSVTPNRSGQTELARLEGELEKRAGRHAAAMRAFDRAVGLSPEDLALRTERAFLLNTLGKRREAKVDLEYILARQPNNAPVQKALADLQASEAAKAP